MTFRFNRDKLVGTYSYSEFTQAANDLVAMVRRHRSDATLKILTFGGTGVAKRYARADISGDDAMETYDYLEYTLSGFTEEAYNQSIDAEVRFDVAESEEPFVVTMTISNRPERKKLFFWGQLVTEPLFAEIYNQFAKPGMGIVIGNEVDRNSVIGCRKPKRAA